MFNTGARVQEVIGLRARDLQLTRPYQVRLFGKGRKERICPLWQQTAQVLRAHCVERQIDLTSEARVFLNHRGTPLTRFVVRYILGRHLERARAAVATLARKRLHPHSMRHTTAAALLKSGVDLSTISQWLGHLRLKAARKLRIDQVPVILCDEWAPAQVKAFRLMVNRSVNWATWDDELLALELQEFSEADFDLSLTGFDPGEIDALLLDREEEEKANAAPPLPENPVSRPGDLWLCGPHRVLCGDATSQEAVARLLGARKPLLMVTDPPYASSWTASGETALA
jgi:hypothetical protein